MGFTAKGFKATRDDINQNLSLPVIAHVIIDQKLLHFLVIYAINRRRILIADPRRGMVKYKPEEFFKIWTGGLILLTPNADFKKRVISKSMLFRFFTLLIPLKKQLLFIFIASLFYTALGIIGSFYIKFLFDDILKNRSLHQLQFISLGFVAVFIIQTLLYYFRSFLLAQFGLKIDRQLMLEYYHHVLHLPMNFFTSRKVGEIVSRFMDAAKIRDGVSGASLTIMIDSLMAIAGGVILYRLNAGLFLITLVSMGVYAILVMLFNQPIRDINLIQMEDNSKLTSYLVESLEGIESVKAFHAEAKIGAETEHRFDKLIRSLLSGSKLSALLTSLTTGISGTGTILILWLGTASVLQGRMTAGQLLTFSALLVYFLNPIKNLIDLQSTIQTAMAAAARLGEILELQVEKATADQTKQLSPSLLGEIEYKNVQFRYGAKRLVLKDINLVIRPGEKIALAGESGSGKTTLIKLLLNFYQPEQGEISISGHSLENLSISWIRSKIALISQDTFLFSGTVTENLCLGVSRIDPERIMEAAKAAQAHQFIEELPLKYDTYIEENGANLSGGQKQRLAIARALLINPDIIIMDEATSNLDSITETTIAKTIQNLNRDKTVIVIAHRLSTIMRCDRILVMAKGEIVESGSHEYLLSQKGIYYNMWKAQLS